MAILTPESGPAQSGFADLACRLAGVAALHFGWSPAQFWNATPAELNSIFAALTARHGAGADAGPPAAADIARLMKEFPDG